MARVLVVDDEYTFADFAKIILTSLGHTIEVCLESARAFDVALRFRPDILITDLNMPDLDGLELIKRMKGTPETRHVHILLASSSTDKSDRNEAQRLGAIYSIVKPLQKESIKMLIDQLVPPKKS